MKKKIFLVTHEFPPMHGGVGVSSKRIFKVLNHNYDVKVVLITNNKAIETSNPDVILINIDTNESADSVTAEESSFKSLAFQQQLHVEFDAHVTRMKPDLIIDLFFTNFGLITTLIAKKHNVKHIVSIRGNDIGKHIFMPEIFSQIGFILKNADYIISVNQELLDVSNTIVDIKNKSSVIHNSINLNEISHKDIQVDGLDNTKVIIGCVGIFRYKKGIRFLLEAAQRLSLDFQILLIGDYKDSKEKVIHEKLIRRTGLEDRVILTGLVPHEDRFSYTKLMDIAVIPSLFSEGCPSTLLEAMALKIPVITTNAGACGEIIDNNLSGFVVNQASSEEIYISLKKLIESRYLQDKFKNQAYEKIKLMNNDNEYIAWSKVIDELLK